MSPSSISTPNQAAESPPGSLDPALVRKYSVAGPRYTSYPTALQFSDTVKQELLLGEIHRSPDDDSRPLSLYFHLPFCETRCWFCGCTTVITRDHDSANPYIDALEKEMDLIAQRIHPARPVVQMHWGGGTPTFLSPRQVRRLGDAIRKRFNFSRDAEFAVEIDPRRLSREHIEALRDSGANRASLGVQDNNPQVQQAVNRIQPPEMTERAVTWLREAGFESINIDLIYGLPRQTPDSVDQTLCEVLTLKPERLAVFSYAHVPWIKPAQRIFEKRGDLPSPEMKLDMLCRVVERLTRAGYVNIGMDHFALPSDELAVAQREGALHRNFQGYSTRAGADICGFGMSSISQTANTYRQNEKELPAYYRRISRGELPVSRGYVLDNDDRIRRNAIMRVMCDLQLDYAELSQRLGVDFEEYFGKEIASLGEAERDGLLQRFEGGLRLTPLGRLLVRNIAMAFDWRLKQGPKGFSRTV